jgi:tetratricopeptide (TPR) repeat protein
MFPRIRLLIFLLAVFFCLSAHASTDQWIEVRSAHFLVATDSNEKQARRVLDQFERMRWVFQTLFPKANADPADPIVVVAAKNGKVFQSMEPAAYLAKGALNLAGYFTTNQQKNYILLRLDAEQENPFATVYHEFTHLQFRSAGAYMPLWLNEGIAEFFQNTEFMDKTVRLGKPSTSDILYLRQQSLIPLAVLLRVDASSPYYHQEEKGSAFYAESWALTHMLFIQDRKNGTHKMDEYLGLMRLHADPVDAAEKTFGPLKNVQAALQNYIGANSYTILQMNSAAVPVDESEWKVQPLSGTDADALRAEVLSMVQREDEARQVLSDVLKAEPGNARAMATMGEIELRAGKRQDARKWFGQAVEADSKAYAAAYQFAVLAIDDQSVDNETIENSLKSAMEANPKFAPAYDRMAALYLMRKHDNERALPLIQKAVELDPANVYYRMNLANVLMNQQHFAEAETALRAAIRAARTQNEVNMVQQQLERAKEAEQAKAAFEEEQKRRDAEPKTIPASMAVTAATVKLKHPDEAKGPKHMLVGVMHEVTCSAPMVIEFKVQGQQKAARLYANDFTKIDLSALGFEPPASMNPCADFEGRKARVQYAEAGDSSVDGMVVAIELRK